MAVKKEMAAAYELKITLLRVEPAVWRRVLVPRDIILDDLHLVIQRVMGWDNDHMHEFLIGRKRYGMMIPDDFGFSDSTVDESIVRLNGVAKPKAKFQYLYDFGDNWAHEIVIEREIKSESNERLVSCTAGENACPPEDCGGVYGYENMLKILADDQDDEYSDIKEWLGDDFDPTQFDLKSANQAVAEMRV